MDLSSEVGGRKWCGRIARQLSIPTSHLRLVFSLVLLFAVTSPLPSALAQTIGFQSAVRAVQPKTVKVFGAGGFRGLEAYQSGLLVSSEGHVLTVWSYVLDGETTTISLDDGETFEAKLVGYDPRLEIAILKIEASGLPFFDLKSAVEATIGSKVLAFSNCYKVATGNEPVSVQQGVVAAKTKLDARRGAFQAPYDGDVYVLDAMTNNPGAAGGVVTDRKGRVVGLIGKELRDSRTGSWLNFAIPIASLSKSVDDIISGKKILAVSSKAKLPTEPMTEKLAGFSLVPNVISRTPPYVDSVRVDSPASRAGLLHDDLIIEVNGQMATSCSEVLQRISEIDRDTEMTFTVQRGSEFVNLKISLVGN